MQAFLWWGVAGGERPSFRIIKSSYGVGRRVSFVFVIVLLLFVSGYQRDGEGGRPGPVCTGL